MSSGQAALESALKVIIVGVVFVFVIALILLLLGAGAYFVYSGVINVEVAESRIEALLSLLLAGLGIVMVFSGFTMGK